MCVASFHLWSFGQIIGHPSCFDCCHIEPFACHGMPQIKILWVFDKQAVIKLQLKSCDPVVLVV